MIRVDVGSGRKVKTMTANQISMASLQETSKHNRATEYETNRNNLATESETSLHNRNTESETGRHNLATETETNRSNLANEGLQASNQANQLAIAQLQTAAQQYAAQLNYAATALMAAANQAIANDNNKAHLMGIKLKGQLDQAIQDSKNLMEARGQNLNAAISSANTNVNAMRNTIQQAYNQGIISIEQYRNMLNTLNSITGYQNDVGSGVTRSLTGGKWK